MKPTPFDYAAPSSVDACLDALAEAGDNGKILAGGQSLVPMMALRLTSVGRLIDINRISELAAVGRDGDVLSVGALTRHADLERDEVIADAVPVLKLVAPFIGHFQIRNRGTTGGSLAHADASAELPAVARLLDAVFVLKSRRGERLLPAKDFFQSTFVTAIEPDELLVSVRYPIWPRAAGFAVEEVARRHGDFALVGAMCGVHVDDGRIARVAIATTGMGSVPARVESVEQALVGSPAEEVNTDEVGAAFVADLEPASDIHATADYRRRIGAYLVSRVLTQAILEASRG